MVRVVREHRKHDSVQLFRSVKYIVNISIYHILSISLFYVYICANPNNYSINIYKDIFIKFVI